MTAGHSENQSQATSIQGKASEKEYFGALKSYNERRGFGFIACAETAAEFGRDVYMAKQEAQGAAEELLAMTSHPEQETPAKARLSEGDLVRFTVKLSIEGFPQAAEVRCLCKFRGTVIRSPGEEGKPGRVKSEDVTELNGNGEVLVSQEACGHVILHPGDEVSFCIPDKGMPLLEAKLVMLEQSERLSGSVLGCCLLHLPRPSVEGQACQAPLSLDCHGFCNKLILSGLPADVGDAELMRFFSKQGATKVIAAHALACSFASVNFPSQQELVTFLGRSAHAFSDDKETHIAELHEHAPGSCSAARLPALPAPTATVEDQPGSIMVTWTPLQLAAGYFVELRPVGTAEWAFVDVTANGHQPGFFDASCSSCKVNGLRPGFAYESRVSYISSCGCRSEASEASQAVTPHSPTPQPSMPQVQPPFESVSLAGWPGASPGAVPTLGTAPASPNSRSLGASFFPVQSENHLAQPRSVWRCVHGCVNPPPPVPELHQGDEAGFSVVVRWPSVAQAVAYVVELREAGSPIVERIMRAADAAAPGSLVELRVGGLRPLYGQQYAAQVRSVARCGCESCPSEAGFSQPIGMIASQPRGAQMLGTSPPVWHQGQPFPESNAVPVMLSDMSVHGAPVVPPPEMEPSATKSQELMAAEKVTHKEPPPEVTGQEECLILD